jgi:hypothetical protein
MVEADDLRFGNISFGSSKGHRFAAQGMDGMAIMDNG